MQALNGLVARGRYLATGWRPAIAATRGLATALGLAGAAEGHGAAPAGPPVTDLGLGGDGVRVLGAGARSRWVDLDGPVHYLDFGGPADGPVVVCVHGLAGSAVNWSALAPLLTGRFRVLALDLPGNGLTQSLGRGTDMLALRGVLHRFIEAVPGGPVILAGNSMGGMICLLEAGAAAANVTCLVLAGAVLPLVPALPDQYVTPLLAAYAMPVLGPLLMSRWRRMPPEAMVASVLSLCCVDDSRVPADVVTAHVMMARQTLMSPGLEREIAVSARSIIASMAWLRGGAFRRAIGAVTCPVLLVHGTRDRMVPIAVARSAARAHPAWELIEMPGVGHVPQLEASDGTAAAVIGWLGSAGLDAAGPIPASPALPA